MRTYDRSRVSLLAAVPPMMIVLGIDPGIANTGWGVVAGGIRPRALAHGTIRTPASAAPEQRLAAIHVEVEQLLDAHAITDVALESLFFGKNTSSAVAVGQARGVTLALAGRRGLACASYTPQHVKQAVCGRGAADKRQVQRMISALLQVQPSSDHAADALAVALCHVQRAPLQSALKAAS